METCDTWVSIETEVVFVTGVGDVMKTCDTWVNIQAEVVFVTGG